MIQGVHRPVGQHTLHTPNRFDDDVPRRPDVGAVGDAHMGLDPVTRIGIGVVDDLVLADQGIGHDDHAVVAGADARGAQADLHHVAPGAHALNLDPVADPIGAVGQDDEAGDGVREGILGGQRKRQAADSQRCRQGGDVDAKVGEQDGEGDGHQHDTGHSCEEHKDRVKLVHTPSFFQSLALPVVSQVDQAPQDPRTEDDAQHEVDITQRFLQLGAQKYQPVGGKTEDQDHHQPPETRADGFCERIGHLGGGTARNPAQQDPGHQAADRVADQDKHQRDSQVDPVGDT